MTEKTYEFHGIDAKTEWKFAIILGVTVLMLAVLFTVIYLKCFDKPSYAIRLPALALFIGLSLICGHYISLFMGRKIRKSWKITVSKNGLQIWYDNKEQSILWKDIIGIKNYGNAQFRYVTIKSSAKTIKIRVGNSDMAPFSENGDVQTLDAFVMNIQNYLERPIPQ